MKPEERQEQLRIRFKEKFEGTDYLEPAVSMRIGRNDYTLECTNRAARNILKDTGINLLSEGLKMEDLLSPDKLGIILYYCLKKHHPEMTQDAADDIWGPRHRLYVTDKVQTVISLFLPDVTGLQADAEESAQLKLVKGGQEGEDPLPLPSVDGSASGQPGEDSDFLKASSGAQH